MCWLPLWLWPWTLEADVFPSPPAVEDADTNGPTDIVRGVWLVDWPCESWGVWLLGVTDADDGVPEIDDDPCCWSGIRVCEVSELSLWESGYNGGWNKSDVPPATGAPRALLWKACKIVVDNMYIQEKNTRRILLAMLTWAIGFMAAAWYLSPGQDQRYEREEDRIGGGNSCQRASRDKHAGKASSRNRWFLQKQRQQNFPEFTHTPKKNSRRSWTSRRLLKLDVLMSGAGRGLPTFASCFVCRSVRTRTRRQDQNLQKTGAFTRRAQAAGSYTKKKKKKKKKKGGETVSTSRIDIAAWSSLEPRLSSPPDLGRVRFVLGKCKALWGKPRTLLRLSQRSTELFCTRFDEERSKKSKAIDEQRCGTVLLREHISPRTSSTVVRVQVVGVCEVRTLAGMPGLVIVLDPACACQWERRRTLKKG